MVRRFFFILLFFFTLAVVQTTQAHHCADQGGNLRGDCNFQMITGPRSQAPTYDPDGDEIPNRRDACPTQFALHPSGCQQAGYDSDGDGLPDAEDWCLYLTAANAVPGSTGCPGEPTPGDKDADTVPDGEDRCPATPGSKLAGGCMDSDGDRRPDASDQCPHFPGLSRGCPDTDRDSWNDVVDQCPTQRAGRNSTNGCRR